MRVTSENVTGPPPFTVYFDVDSVSTTATVDVDYGDGSTDSIQVYEGDLAGAVHTYQEYGTYTATFTHPTEWAETVEITVEDEPAPEEPEYGAPPSYQLVVTRDHGGGTSSSVPYPFPAEEPVMDAAEAVAAVYLANGATKVTLIKTEEHVTKTTLNP